MKKPYKVALANVWRDGSETIANFHGLSNFIRENQIWNGLTKYTWLSKFLMLVGIIGGIAFIRFVFNYWSAAPDISTQSLAGFGTTLGNFFVEGYDLFIIGGLKYVILILMEVVIFHFARRTIEIKTGEDIDTSLKAFIEAQIRMVKVVFYSYLMESIVTFLVVKLAFSMLGLHFLDPVATLLIQSYFLGFAVIDNYNEIYHMTIKQSFKYTQQYAAVALIVGLVVYIIMMLPLLGTLLGPLIGAVVGAMTMYELHQIDQNMAWVFVTKEKE